MQVPAFTIITESLKSAFTVLERIEGASTSIMHDGVCVELTRKSISADTYRFRVIDGQELKVEGTCSTTDLLRGDGPVLLALSDRMLEVPDAPVEETPIEEIMPDSRAAVVSDPASEPAPEAPVEAPAEPVAEPVVDAPASEAAPASEVAPADAAEEEYEEVEVVKTVKRRKKPSA